MKACGRPEPSAISRAGRSRARRRQLRQEAIKEINQEIIREVLPENYPGTHPDPAPRQPAYAAPSNGPISLSAPGITRTRMTSICRPKARRQRAWWLSGSAPAYPPRERYPAQISADPELSYSLQPAAPAAPRLGPAQGNSVGAFGQVAMKPAATLACRSSRRSTVAQRFRAAGGDALVRRARRRDQADLGLSCRGMNGNPHANISEHAFGNALDIAAFTLADGRRITVKDGWRGMPEEQGFLRDVQAAACQQFNTVLAPGSNSHHEDHIHVDLMRRASRRTICQPAAVSGDQVAARAGQRDPYASRRCQFDGGARQQQKIGVALVQGQQQGQRGRRVRGSLRRSDLVGRISRRRNPPFQARAAVTLARRNPRLLHCRLPNQAGIFLRERRDETRSTANRTRA